MPITAVLLKVDPERVADSLLELQAQIAAGNVESVLDFSSVSRIDAKAVQSLEALAGLADAKAARIELRGVNVEIYKVLKLVNVTPGDFLNKDGQQASMVPTIDAASGTGMIALTRPPSAPGISGTGRLVTMTFQPLAAGTASVQVFGATARGPGHEPKSLAAVQAAVTVTAAPVIGAPAK